MEEKDLEFQAQKAKDADPETILYKVGEAADLVGLSVNGVRYYERKGIVNPIHEGAYRYYDIVSLSELMRATNFRDMGFSISDTRTLTHCKDKDILMQTLQKRRTEIKTEIEKLELLSNAIDSRIDLLHEIDTQLARCTLTESPAYVIRPVQHWRYDSLIKLPHFSENYTYNVKWGPETAPSLYIPLAEWEKEENTIDCIVGPGIRYNHLTEAQKTELKEVNTGVFFPGQTCIYTVVNLEDGSLLKRSYFQHVTRYAKQHHLKFTGDIHTCRIAAIRDEKQALNIYIQVWFPVEKES